MDPLPPLESQKAFYARLDTLPEEEQHSEYQKRKAVLALYKEREKKQKDTDDMMNSPVYKQMIAEKNKESVELADQIEKLASKLNVAKEQYRSTHTVDTAADEFMLAKWTTDKHASLASWNRSIINQEEQIEQMKAAFEIRLRGIESNLEGTRNTRDTKAAYFDKRIQAAQERIDIANSYNKTPAIIKMELEIQELEGKKAAVKKFLDQSLTSS
jgi:hypothetical protein